MTLIPQVILLIVSITWVFIAPKYNILTYLKFNFVVIILGAVAGSGLALAGYGFYSFAKKTNKFYEIVELFEKGLAPAFRNLKLVDIILLSLVASFSEEVFFRGLLQQVFGIIIASIAFGLLHLPGFKYWVYALWATLSGVLFGFLFVFSGSLWLPISAHAINNVIGMILLTKLEKA